MINQTFFFPTLAFDVYSIHFPGQQPKSYGLASTPNAAPGAVVRYEPVPQIYAQAGVYSGAPDQSYSGTEFTLSELDGALIYYETGYHLNGQTNDTGLEGSYKLGGSIIPVISRTFMTASLRLCFWERVCRPPPCRHTMVITVSIFWGSSSSFGKRTSLIRLGRD